MRQLSAILLWIAAVSIAQRAGAADTLDVIFDEWAGLVQSAANSLVVVSGVVGIGMVVWSMFRLYSEPDDEDRWKHVAAAGVGSLFTIFGVIVGFWSGLLGG